MPNRPESIPARHPPGRRGTSPRPGRTHRLLHTCLVIGLLSGTVLPAAPAPADDTRYAKTSEELQQLRRRIEQLRQEVAATRDQHDKARNQLRDVDLRISKHVRELKYIHFRLGRQDRRLKQLYRDRDHYQQIQQRQRRLLGKQLYAAYVMGRQAYLKLLLSQDDPAVTGRSLKYYEYFHRSRGKLIEEAKTNLSRIEQNRHAIEQEKHRLTELRTYRRKKKAELESDSQQRRLMVAGLNQQLQGKTASLNRLLKDEQQLQRLLEGLGQVMPQTLTTQQIQQPFASLKGKLTWPAAGTIQRLYGRKRGGSSATWNGIIIQAGAGQEVHAISHGRVAYADWLRGYGLLLIIDHGNGYMSLYGHNQSLYKETGDWVEANEAIATIGNSGGHTQNGLYFEIRHRGKPTNPLNWCRKTRHSWVPVRTGQKRVLVNNICCNITNL